MSDSPVTHQVVIDQGGTVLQVNHYYPFGGLFSEGVQASNQPYRYNGKELDRQLNLDLYDYGARHYDAALGRWLTVDPLAEKYYSISPYAYCGNNPVRYIDPNGMYLDDYVFNEEGRFIKRIINNTPDRIIIDNSKTNQRTIISFADPVNDPKNIDSNTKINFVSDNEISEILVDAGVYNRENQGIEKGVKYLQRESDASSLKGDGNMDFAGNGRNKIDVSGKTLYVTKTKKDGYVAHNGYNFGNFLWGAGEDALGVPMSLARFGAHLNNFFNDPKYKGHLDSKDDQYSIKVGFNWGKYPNSKLSEGFLFFLRQYPNVNP